MTTIQTALAAVEADVQAEITAAGAAATRAKENGDLGQEEQAAQWAFAATKTQGDLVTLANAINPPVSTSPPVTTPPPVTTSPPVTTPPATGGKVPLGTYTDPQGSWQSTTKFGTETGCKVSIRTDYAARTQATFLNDLQYVIGLEVGMPYRLCLGLPIVDDSQSPVWANATGSGPWVALHKQAIPLIKAKFPNAIIRLGIELNIGTTTPMTFKTPGFVAAFNTIAALYRAAGFLVEFNTVCQTGIDVLAIAKQCLPNYDLQTADPYDQLYAGTSPNNTPAQTAAAWASLIGGVDGLNALATFARANGKGMAFAEWGVGKKGDGHGLGDDPTYIANVIAFITANADLFEKGYVSYFDTNNGWDTVLADSPNSLAEFKKVGPAVFGAA